MTRPDLHRALQEHFGFTSFRGPQEAICTHLLDRGSALVVMPTGDGKSLCYQLPALVQDGLTLVVSPLIALMDDQVAALRAKGLPATCVHSMLDGQERQRRLAAVEAGEIRLLYVTPERFRVPGFLERIEACELALFAVDEAHCVSQWGHDFRPDYAKLGEMRHRLGNPPCLALTATATPAVQADIQRALDLGDAPVWHTGLERPNLFLAVHEVDRSEAKLDRLLQIVDRVGGPGIVYTALIKDLLALEAQLEVRGYRPLVYHGKLSANERRTQQARFVASPDALVLATNAFGMGVDKPDVRFVVHWQVPRNLEAYYQEIGRAGRDGAPALCELLYFEEDVSIQREFTDWANPDRTLFLQIADHLASLGDRVQTLDVQALRETFLLKNRRDGRIETVLRLLRTMGCCSGELDDNTFEWHRAPTAEEIAEWLPEDKHRRDLEGLLAMVRYAREPGCRKQAVHRHFGFEDSFEHGCGTCDGELDVAAWLDRHVDPSAIHPIPHNQPAARATPPGTAAPPVERGEWIEVRGHGLCAVVRVHHHRGRTQVDVERARDLTPRSFDLGRVKWRKVEGS